MDRLNQHQTSGMMSTCVDDEVSIIVVAPKLIPRENVRVCSKSQHNRHPITDTKLASKLEKTWHRRIVENPRIWNGTKFRVDRVEMNSHSLIFHLGITCYKDFLSTNWADYASELKALGRDGGNEQMYMSDAMGVGALVVTKDDRIILIRRSQHCAEAAGCWDIPGGHAEPEVSLFAFLSNPILFVIRHIGNRVSTILLRQPLWQSCFNVISFDVIIRFRP